MQEDKTVAVVAYFSLIGFIIALVLHQNNRTRLGAFHLRQCLGLMLTSIVVWFCSFVLIFIPFLGFLAILGILGMLLAAWIHGLVNAAQGDEQPIPVIGPLFQDLFKGIN